MREGVGRCGSNVPLRTTDMNDEHNSFGGEAVDWHSKQKLRKQMQAQKRMVAGSQRRHPNPALSLLSPHGSRRLNTSPVTTHSGQPADGQGERGQGEDARVHDGDGPSGRGGRG